MKALILYAKFLKKQKAAERILADIKKDALRELSKMPEGKANFFGVEFHLTTKRTPVFAPDIEDVLKNLRAQIDEQKKLAEDAKKVTYDEKPTFDASIPKSAEKQVLSEVKDYAKHFGLK